MSIKQAPYVMLNGNAGEALEFYQSVFGGTTDITRYRDMPMDEMPGEPDWIMHGQVETPSGITIMAADGDERRNARSNVVICVYGDDQDELARHFAALEDGGDVAIPFGEAPWGAWFGQLTDRFGVEWMIEGGGDTTD